MIHLNRTTLIPIALFVFLAFGFAVFVASQKFWNGGVTPIQLEPQSSSLPIKDWNIYQNPKYKFEIRYPSGWYSKEYYSLSSDAELLLLFSRGPSTFELGDYWPDLNLIVLKTPYDQAELQQSGLTEGILSPDGLRFDQVRYEPTTFMGLPANRITSASRGPWDFPHTELIFNYEAYGWKIEYPNIDYRGNHLPVYDDILSTFKIIPR